jgi:hypothetical protein
MAAPVLKNDTVKVRQLVEDYRAGRLVIPEFQRDYVWRRSKAPWLIDSLYRNFPISTLLYWQSSEYATARRSKPKPSSARTMNWLIDGQQRVMTLSKVMSGDEGIDVLFNSATEKFSLANAATRHDTNWVRVADLLDDNRYRAIRRELPGGARGLKLEEVFDKVRAVRDYEVPVVRMVDHRFQDAVDAFTRINSLGVRLKQQDIEAAQVAARHSGLIADDVIPFTEALVAKGFTRLTVMHLFRVCAFIARPDGRVRTPLHELPRDEVLKAWKLTEKATLAACGQVRSELGLVNMEILWSGSLLVPVIALLATTPPKGRDTREMMGWLALATMLHRYSGSSDTALDQDLRACRATDPIGALLTNLRQSRTSLLAVHADFAGSLNDRSALLAAYIACRHRQMKDFFTGQSVVMQEDIDRHHILPRRQFPEAIRSTADKVANVAFITGEVNKAISHTGPEVYLKEIAPDLLKSQCVPVDPTLWRIKNAEAFFIARRKLLAEALNDYTSGALPGRKL